MDKRDTAIFLGAGFSQEADLPVMSTFGEYSKKQLQSLKDKHGPGSKSPRDAAPLLIKNGEIFEAFQTYCKNHLPKGWPFNPENMEHLFTVAEMMNECGTRSLELVGQQILLPNLLAAIKLWLWQIYRRIPVHNPSRYKIDIEPYDLFVQTICEYGLENISVVTTNYDLILEYLFNKMGLKVRYPLDEQQFEFLDLCDYPDKRIASGIFESGEAMPLLCKLHGSVNYFENQESAEGKLRIVADTAKNSIGKSKIKPGTPAIMAVDAIYKLAVENKFLPAIVAPSYAKLQGRGWLREIWRCAAETLSTARKWIFIGYSFPPSDGFMKSLINLSVMLRKHDPPEVIVADPSKQTQHNYEQVFGKRFRPYPEKFSQFIKSGHFRDNIM